MAPFNSRRSQTLVLSAHTACHTSTAGAGGGVEHVPPDGCEVLQALLVSVSCQEGSGGRKESRTNGLTVMWHK